MDEASQQLFLDALTAALEGAAVYNRNDQMPPAAILWTDKDREWEPLLPQLRPALPSLLTFGPYKPADRCGPAYWLRCVLAHTLPDVLPTGAIPVVYLPGIGRAELRAVEECPRTLQPLAELQYRGALFTQKNGRDWTVAAFLQSESGGLGIQVAADAATREALLRALPMLARVPLAALREAAPLRAVFFDELLHPDEVRTLLRWLDDPKGFEQQCDVAAWQAFRNVCGGKYGFDPVTDGPVTVARRLGGRTGAWELPWRRLAEAPATYQGVAAQLRKARPQVTMFDRSESWPQDNEAAEAELRADLQALDDCYAPDARAAIAELDAIHGPRRNWIWARLGRSPLAGALRRLSALSLVTAQPLGGATVAEIATSYTEHGWRADAAVLDALALVETPADVSAVRAAIRAVYQPWLVAAATAMQQAVAAPGLSPPASLGKDIQHGPGTCLLFSDGLRYDVGCRLTAALEQCGVVCQTAWRLAALPTVTATAKPAVSPVAAQLTGGRDLDAAVGQGGARVTAPVLRKLLADAGYQVLQAEELGDPTGRAWTELGDIDSYCHEHGWKVAKQIDGEVRALAGRVRALLDAGWQRVVTITDHGWLLLPGGLPKASLPEHLTEVRKGRCARMKPFADTNEQTVPWHWDANVRIAVAPDIACYEEGKEVEHGGISPQECVIPVIVATRQIATPAHVTIDRMTWRGLRCAVVLSGVMPGMVVDIRTKAADPATTVTETPKPPSADGAVSLIVPNEEREGLSVLVVALASDGTVLAQAPTTVGGV